MALEDPRVGQTYTLRADLGDDEHALPAGTALKVVETAPPGSAGVELSADTVAIFEPVPRADLFTEALYRRVAFPVPRVLDVLRTA